jgi:hypothetical protein
MMFVPRIWFSEVERIGKQRCTSVGYALQGVGDLMGFSGVVLLVAVPVYLVYQAIVGAFEWSLLWLLIVPFVVGIVGSTLVAFSWALAYWKKFHYDDERCESSWIEAGEKRAYTYFDWQAEVGRRPR